MRTHTLQTRDAVARDAQRAVRLAVIIPVFNEAPTVRKVIDEVWRINFVSEVIVVDDGSTDESCIAICLAATDAGCRHIRHAINRGKGAAIRSALECVSAEFTIIQDADAEYDSRDYEKLLEPLLRGEANVVYGSRYLNCDRELFDRSWFDFGVQLLNLAVWFIFFGVKLTDEATCYKVFPTSLLRAMDLQCERFEFCPEVTAKACRLGLQIKEVPISYSPRSIAEGKKIRLRDGIQALWTLWKYRKWEGHWDCDLSEKITASGMPQTTDTVHVR